MTKPGNPPSEPGDDDSPMLGEDLLSSLPPSSDPSVLTSGSIPSAFLPAPTPQDAIAVPDSAVVQPAPDEHETLSGPVYTPAAAPQQTSDNPYGLIKYVMSSDEVVGRAIRLIGAITMMICSVIVALGIPSIVLLTLPYYRLEGKIGLAATVIISIAGVRWRFKKWRHARKRDKNQ